jgi:Holliday junction resolvase RusA-like endonuclease
MKIYKIDPIGKPRMTRCDKWKQRDCVIRYREFKDKARLIGLDKELEGNALIALYQIKMPKSWSQKKKQEYRGKLHYQTPDIDNIDKGIFDLIPEDSHIAFSCTMKVWGDYGEIIIFANLREFSNYTRIY